MATPRLFRVWRASIIFGFLNHFFKKIQHNILHLELQMIFVHSFGVALNWSESVNSDTKAEITRVWNGLQPKLFH